MNRRFPTMARIGVALALCATPHGARAQATNPYLGQVMVAGFNFCPTGWFPMNGRLLQIQQYTALFALLGTTYGGDGQTTFALPTAKPIFSVTGAPFQTCIAMQGVFPSQN
jgi:microcystin-dependent protein